MLTAILFDLDGTLTDPKHGITRCIQFALTQMGVSPPSEDDLTWCIGPSLRGSLGELLQTSDAPVIEQALSIYRQRFTRIGLYENDLYPDVLDALARIKQSEINIFLSTSKPWVYAERILEYFRLTPYFSGIYGSELDGQHSDKKDLIGHILRCEGLDSGQTLMVGDRSMDIIGGRANGTRTAAVAYGYGTPDEVAAAKPDFIFERLMDLAVMIESQTV